MATALADWTTIENDREKYAAYLCSREWGVLKESVRERSGGICERCKILPQDATHHLTYERKYVENLEDLQAICTHCHEFQHGKSNADPLLDIRVLRYVMACSRSNVKSVPIGLLLNCEEWNSSNQRNELFAISHIHQLELLDTYETNFKPFEVIADEMQDGIGIDFAFRRWLSDGSPTWTQPCDTYEAAVSIIGRYVKFGELTYPNEDDY